METLEPKDQPHPCPRCRHHGEKSPVHFCEVKDCNCKDCKKIALNSQIRMPHNWVKNVKKPTASGKIWCARCRIHGIELFFQHTCKYLECNCPHCWEIAIAQKTVDLKNNKHSINDLKCARCRIHGIQVNVPGHRNNCEFYDCTCPGCVSTTARQLAMAREVALRLTPEEREARQRNNPLRQLALEIRLRLSAKYSGHLYVKPQRQ